MRKILYCKIRTELGTEKVNIVDQFIHNDRVWVIHSDIINSEKFVVTDFLTGYKLLVFSRYIGKVKKAAILRIDKNKNFDFKPFKVINKLP